MEKKRIRRNDRVWFIEDGYKRQGLAGYVRGDFMDIIMDGHSGMVDRLARKKDGKWYAFREKDDYVLEVFKS
jgi:hypothetical protein